MSAYRHTATHMNDNQTKLFVGLANLLGISLSHCLLIQCMEYGGTGKLRHTTVTGNGSQLIYYYGIYDKGRHSDGVTNLTGQDTTQIGCMLTLLTDGQIMKQFIGYRIGTAGNRLQHTTTADYYIQGLQVEVLGIQKVSDNLLSEILLVYNTCIPGNLLCTMS